MMERLQQIDRLPMGVDQWILVPAYVDHQQLAGRLQHPVHLDQCVAECRPVMRTVARAHEVEGAVGERQRGGMALAGLKCCESACRSLNCHRSQHAQHQHPERLSRLDLTAFTSNPDWKPVCPSLRKKAPDGETPGRHHAGRPAAQDVCLAPEAPLFLKLNPGQMCKHRCLYNFHFCISPALCRFHKFIEVQLTKTGEWSAAH